MTAWIVVAVVGAGTVALKALGPALLGARRLPERFELLASLLAPTLLSALVVTQTLEADGVSVDARLVGVGAAGIALALRAPLIVVVVVAAVATAVTRALA
jgi:hypothetical protein